MRHTDLMASCPDDECRWNGMTGTATAHMWSCGDICCCNQIIVRCDTSGLTPGNEMRYGFACEEYDLVRAMLDADLAHVAQFHPHIHLTEA